MSNWKITYDVHIKDGSLYRLCLITSEKSASQDEINKKLDLTGTVREIEVIDEEPSDIAIDKDRQTKVVYTALRDSNGQWLIPPPDNIQNNEINGK